MNGWKETTLDSFVDFKTGKLDSNRAVYGGQYPFFTCSPITLAINDYAFDEEAVLLAGNNANGVFPVKYYKGKFNAYQRTYVILPKNPQNTSVRWVYYLTQSFVRELQELSIGSATRFITKQILDSFPVLVPPLNEQCAIAAILGALDDKIELNRRMNATLETMARALFKSWFVDFDPVRAKMEGRQPFGMDAETASLFPSRLVPSDLGDIPEGWSIASIYDIADIVNGAPFQSELFNQEKRGLPLIRIRDLNSCNPAYYTDEKHPKAEIVHTGDIVVGMDAEFRAHYWMGKTAYLNQRLFTARPKHNSKVFVREGLIPLLAKEENAQVGTTVAHIGKKDIDKFKVVFPSERILQLFAEQSNPILEKMVAISIETRKLEKTRDYLLPKLISGDIRIPDAEKFVGSA